MHTNLENLYHIYNHRRYVEPDPLQFLYAYPGLRDRAIVGLIAASLAFGNVKQIIRSVSAVLDRMPSPAQFLEDTSRSKLDRTFAGFRHRYATDNELVALLWGIREAIAVHGSLGQAFADKLRRDDEGILPPLTRFVHELAALGQLSRNYLLPDPARGSACKRLHLYLRWMVRQDAVDPGGWTCLTPDRLVVPLDTHMHRIGLRLGLTRRNQADARTALEITDAFRRFTPGDPVRYDFSLTRLGIRSDAEPERFFASCALRGVPGGTAS